MGFFSDLKDDLSQAVNEIKPEVSPAELEAEAEAEFEAAKAQAASEEYSVDISDDTISELLETIEERENAESFSMPEEAPAEDFNVADYVASTPEPETVAAPVAPAAFAPAAPVGRVAADEVSTIMESMIINGNMATEGSLEIRGAIVGNVEALGKLNITGSVQGNSSAAEVFAEGAKITGEIKSLGAIKIGQSTTIIGNVFATSAVVAGAVKGDIDVKGPVILDSTAIVLGNIKSKAVQINNGAVIEGMCSQCYAEVNPTSFFEELKKMK